MQSRCSLAWASSRWHNEAGTKQTKPSAAIRLALHQLEFSDLAFRLPVRPRCGQGCSDRSRIGDDALPKRREQARAGIRHPPCQRVGVRVLKMRWDCSIMSRAAARVGKPISITATL